jgi:hypothetical protein
MMHTISRPFAAVILLALGVVTGSWARTQDVRTMTIDFLALDQKGEPIGPLTPADVSVKVSGKDLAVRSVELITLGARNPATASHSPSGSADVPAAFGATQPRATETGRNILLLIDEGTLFSVEKIVKDSVAQLIAALTPRDRIGLVTTRPGGATVNFTTNHASVRDAVDAMIMGRGNTGLCVGALIDQVRSLAESLPRGRATTLALIPRGAGSGAVTTAPQVSAAGNCSFRREELPPVAEAVEGAQISYHVFHVGGTGLSPNLDNFAGATSGETGSLSWTDAGGIARAIKRSSSFYRATVTSLEPGNTAYQRSELKVNKPDVRVDAPRYLTVPRTAPAFVEAADLLRGDIFRSDLPIRVAAFTSRNEGALPIKLVVVVEPAETKVSLTSAMISVVGADGEIAGQWTARRSDLSRFPLVTAVPVKAGTYRIRAAAADEEGRGGLAEYEVDAALQGTGPVRMSAIALGTSSGGTFVPRLLFGAEPQATAYLEVYGAPAAATVQGTFEISLTRDGEAIVSVPAVVQTSGGVHILTAALPLTSVAADGIARARITVDGAPAGAVFRALRKSGR